MLSSEFLAQLLKEIIDHPIVQELTKSEREIMFPIILAPSGILIPKLAGLGSDVRAQLPDINEVAELCRQHNAKCFMLLHTHPDKGHAGIAEPSEGDIEATVVYRAAARKYGLVLIDHLIISTNCSKHSCFSFRGAGLL